MTRKWVMSHVADLDDIRFADLRGDDEQTYIRLYKLAGKLDSAGLFIERGRTLTNAEIAYRIRLPLQQLTRSMKVLQQRKLLHVNGKGPQIVDWAHQQADMEKVREQTRERMSRYRDRLRDSDVVTRNDELHRHVTSPEPESEPEPESRLRRRPTTPNPSSAKGDLAGRKVGKKSDSTDAVKLNKTQRVRYNTIKKILASFKVRNPKLETISIKLATRNYKSNEQLTTYLLAGIASSITDDSAKNKAAIAAHRLEHDDVQQQFMEPSEWRCIPKEVLTASGIDDLDAYIVRKKYSYE